MVRYETPTGIQVEFGSLFGNDHVGVIHTRWTPVVDAVSLYLKSCDRNLITTLDNGDDNCRKSAR